MPSKSLQTLSCIVKVGWTQDFPYSSLKKPETKFIPLYRMAYGGIIIYDIDADIPGQPVPVESRVSWLNSFWFYKILTCKDYV